MSTLAAAFLGYTIAIGLLGLVSSRFSRATKADFLIADRGLGAWVAGLSAAASAESGWVTLGLVGFAFNTGIAAFWVVPGTVAAFVFNWFVLAPRLRKQASQCQAITVTDVLVSPNHAELSCDQPAGRSGGNDSRDTAVLLIRLVSIAVIVTMLVAYCAAQFNAAGKMFSTTFRWDYSSGVIVGAGFVLAYTLVGGFRAVAWTDVAQSIVMILTVVVVPIVVIMHNGGLAACWQQLAAMDGGGSLTDPVAGKSGAALLAFLALWLGIPLGNHGQPHVLLRMMAAKDDTAIRRAGIISSMWVLVLFSGAVLLGISARVHFGLLDDPERALPMLATDATIIPGLVGGFILAAILAAICSTADSQLLVAASSISHDLITQVFRYQLSLRQTQIIDRCAVVLVGLLAVLIATWDVRSVFTFVLDYGWAGLGAGFGPALIMRLLVKRTTSWGILFGMIIGVAVAVVWRAMFPELHRQVYCLVPAFFTSLIVIAVVSRLTVSRLTHRE